MGNIVSLSEKILIVDTLSIIMTSVYGQKQER